jgi:hypothetical protein
MWKFVSRALAALALIALPASATAQACDRACLKGMIDGYLEALAARDPARTPLAKGVKFTENGARLFPGEGFWKTAGPLGGYRLYAIDPEAGQAAVHALASEAGEPVILLVRLKVDAGKITEAETLVSRKFLSGGLFAPQNLGKQPDLFGQPVPAGQRASRAQLIAAADAYFTAVQTEGTPGYRPAPFADDANRFENGLQTTNVSIRGLPAMTIAQQLDAGLFKGVTITDRRYPVVDVEQGVVLGVVVFRRPDATMPPEGGKGEPLQYHGLVSEMFKVSGGKIREVRAAMLPRPYGAPTGWE